MRVKDFNDPPPRVREAARFVGGSMTGEPVSVSPTADAAAVTRVMLDHGLRAVPVVDDGRLVGVVTWRDVLRTIARDDRDIAREIRSRFRIVCPGEWGVEVSDGVVTLVTEDTDPGDQHVAETVAAAQPGVLAVRIVDPTGAGRS